MTSKQLDDATKANIDSLVEKAAKAAKEFRSYTQEQVDEIVKRATLAFLPYSMKVAEMVQESMGFGYLEDKYFKNICGAGSLYNYLRDKKTVGIINRHENGIVEFAEPVGVVAGILNCTGAGTVDYMKIANALKTRNSIVLAPHPRTTSTSMFVAELLHNAAVKAGAPTGCIQCIEEPSIIGTKYLMSHPKVSLVWATGGGALVKAAYSSGKPALGVGPGNAPVYIDEDVDTDIAVESILMSKDLDGSVGCMGESNLFVHKGVREEFLRSMDKYGYYIVNKEQKEKLLDYMFPVDEGIRKFNPGVVGLATSSIIKNAKIDVPLSTKILVCEMDNNEVGRNYSLSGEKLSNVLTLYTVDSAEQAIDLAIKTLEYSGKGHMAVIHSNNEKVRIEFAEKIPASRIVSNAPSAFAGALDTYNKRIPSASVGCGKMGGTSTTQSINYMELLDIKRYSERMEEQVWYMIPKEIYKDNTAIEYLSNLKGKKIFAVIDPGITKMVEEKLSSWIPKDNEIFVCNDVEPDPSFEIIEKGYQKVKEFNPDTILTIGGGSTIDCAKGIWVRYEYPNIDLKDLGQPFYDVFKQPCLLPKMGKKAEFIAAPTTCGTGSEITPGFVLTGKKENRKFIIANYEIVPNVALLIPEFIYNLPKSIMVETAFDALVHAIEGYVSVLDCPPADINSIKAVKMIFDNLPKAYLKNDNTAKANLLYAASEAGKAAGNAFLGINHSLAHQIGAQFKIPHGTANAIFLLPVVKFNSRPVKEAFHITAYPNNRISQAPERYVKLAKKALGITGSSTQDIINKFCLKIHELMNKCNIEVSLSRVVDKEKYHSLIPDMAKNALQDFCLLSTPIQPSLKDLERLFEEVY